MPKKYLLRDDVELDRLIGEKIREEKQKIVGGNKHNLIGLFLGGSFSRGEGSAYFVDNKPLILSDFDFFATTLFPIKIKSTADISQVPFYKLMFVKNQFEIFEWKYYANHLYGFEFILKLLPTPKINNVELVRLIASRRDRTKNIKDHLGDSESRMRLILEISKFVFSMADLELFNLGIYTPSIREKVELLNEQSDKKWLKRTCGKLLKFRTFPEKSNITLEKLINETEKYYSNEIASVFNRDG